MIIRKITRIYDISDNLLIRAFFLMLMIWTGGYQLSGQQINRVKANQYEYVGQIYRYADLVHIFGQDDLSYGYYISARRQLKTGFTLGIISLGSIGVGFIMSGAGSSADSWESVFDSLYAVAISGIVGSVTGMAGIAFTVSGNKNRRRSFVAFNEFSQFSVKKQNNVLLKIGGTNHGLGLTIHF